jgi:hypothetical protein
MTISLPRRPRPIGKRPHRIRSIQIVQTHAGSAAGESPRKATSSVSTLASERAGDGWRTHVVSDRNAYIVTPRNEINVAETYEYIEAITQLCAATNKIFRKPKIRALTRMGDIKSP